MKLKNVAVVAAALALAVGMTACGGSASSTTASSAASSVASSAAASSEAASSEAASSEAEVEPAEYTVYNTTGENVTDLYLYVAGSEDKGALKMLTRNIASEYGEYNIQCNGMGPGYIATAQTAPLRETQPDGSRHPFDTFICAKTPQAAGAPPRTWSAPACSWLPMLPTLSMARSFTLMAASWLTSASSPSK